MSDLESLEPGWYWLHNRSITYGESIWRVVKVFDHQQTPLGKWDHYPSGKYVLMCGEPNPFPMSYFSDWKEVRFVKLEVPSE